MNYYVIMGIIFGAALLLFGLLFLAELARVRHEVYLEIGNLRRRFTMLSDRSSMVAEDLQDMEEKLRAFSKGMYGVCEVLLVLDSQLSTIEDKLLGKKKKTAKKKPNKKKRV